jgi:Ca2+-binding RTX toxin-like protein
MTLPTAEETMNLYLYGQKEKPKNLIDESLIRSADAVTAITVSTADYMAGPGRFAIGSSFPLITDFFQDTTLIPGKEYTKAELAAKYGYSFYGLSFSSKDVADGNSDYAERTFVWGSVAFQISDSARFVVDANGNHEILNFAVAPLVQGGSATDNFDFNSNDSVTGIGGAIFLQPDLDPSNIGRKVIFNIEGDPPKTTYTQANYDADLHTSTTWSNPGLPSLFTQIRALEDQLFIKESVDFRSDGKPVIYGTLGNDTLSTKPLIGQRYLGSSLANGVVEIAGKGNDVLYGGVGSAILIGGDGTDQLFAGSGGAMFDGGVSNGEGDTYIGGEGIDTFIIGNGGHAAQGVDALFNISKVGKDDRLVLRLSDTLGPSSDLNASVWTKGIVLQGGIQALKWQEDGVILTPRPEDPNILEASFSTQIVSANISTTAILDLATEARAQSASMSAMRPDLGNFEVDYLWDKRAGTLDISIYTAYGNFKVHVDGYKDGDLGLNFIDAKKPNSALHLQNDQGDAEGVLKQIWSEYANAMRGLTSRAAVVDITSPGSVSAGEAKPVTATLPEDGGYLPDFPTGFNPGAGSNADPNAAPDKNDPRKAPFANQHRKPFGGDPLVFDLAGDGIRLTDHAFSSVYVDYTGTGFGVRTGWVDPTEGILINYDGTNSIGADTILGAQSGDGFGDLAQFDTNRDGVVNGDDSGAASLRLWVDGDQNGQIGPDELYTLADAGVASISTTAEDTGAIMNGNTIDKTGEFTRADGSSGDFADVAFGTDTVLTKQTLPDGFELSATAASLPSLDGYGFVSDLQVAMTQNQSLETAVLTLVQSATSMSASEFDQAFEGVVQLWANAANINPDSQGEFIDARHLAVVQAFYGQTFASVAGPGATPDEWTAEEVEATYRSIIDAMKIRFVADLPSAAAANGVSSQDLSGTVFAVIASGVQYRSQDDAILVDTSAIAAALAAATPTSSADRQAFFDKFSRIAEALRVDLFDENRSALSTAFNNALNNAGLSSGWIAQIGAELSADNILAAQTSETSVSGTSYNDAILASSADQSLLGGAGTNSYIYTSTNGNVVVNDAGVGSQLVLTDLNSSDVAISRNTSGDIVLSISSTGKSITILNEFSGAGVDSIAFADISLTRWDLAEQLSGPNTYVGSDDDDNVSVPDDTSGVTYTLGKGDDQFSGYNANNNTFVYRLGDGNDQYYAETPEGSTNVLVLQDLNPDDVTLAVQGSDITISIISTGETITLTEQYQSEGTVGISELRFADGTVWARDVVEQRAVVSSPQYEVILTDNQQVFDDYFPHKYVYSSSTDDVFVYPSQGTFVFSDIASTEVSISSYNSNNGVILTNNANGNTLTLANGVGSSGSVQIQFSDGVAWNVSDIRQKLLDQGTNATSGTIVGYDYADNVIVAGTGNKTLSGGATDEFLGGSNTYVYSSAGGNDTIASKGLLKFTDISSSDVSMNRSFDDRLSITIVSTGRLLTVTNQFSFGSVDIQFSDGITWTSDQIAQMLLDQQSSSGSNGGHVYGSSNRDDTFIAGTGDRYMYDTGGANTYIYSSSGGNDSIEDYGRGSIISFSDIASTDVSIKRASSSLADVEVTIGSTGKTVTIKGLFSRSIDSISFSDGVSWSVDQIEDQILIQDSLGTNDIFGFSGHNDTIYAGSGDKFLSAGGGNDTYVYSSAGGNVRIYDSGSSSRLLFSDIASSQVTLAVSADNGLAITNTVTGKTVTVETQFGEFSGALKEIVFSDGIVLTPDAVEHLVANSSGGSVGGASTVTLSGALVAENSAFGTVVGNVSAVDTDPNAVLTYSLADNAEGRFNVDATTGELTVGYGFLLDYEVQTSHQITVRVTDQNGVSLDKNFNISLTDVTEGPALPTDDVIGGTDEDDVLDGHGGNDQLVGYGGNDTFIFNQGYGKLLITQTEQESGALGTLNLGTGISASDVSVATTADGDVVLTIGASGDVVTIAGMANDAGSGLDEVHFADGTIWSRQDVLTAAQSQWIAGGGSVAENAANGTVVGTVAAAEANAESIYSLIDNAGGRFAIDAATGQVTVTDGASLDYEIATSYSITVRLTGQDGSTVDKQLTVALEDVNEAPTGATLTGNSVSENAANGTIVGTVNGADPDAGSTLAYSLTDNAGGRFTINSTTGQITVANGALLDFETTTSHNITVRVTDQGGLTFDNQFSIAVTDVNEATNHAPNGASLSGGSVVENAANGTVVGTVTGTDPDAGSMLTYSLTNDAGGRFTINSATGQITVANGALLDFETATSHNITVRVTDQGGLIFDKNFTIGLSNANEAPTGASLSGGSVAENAANGTVVGTVTGTDPDSGSVLTYSLTNNAGGRFTINSMTGQITVANGALLDFETATSHNITVRVTDQGGLTFDKQFSIAITDENETTNHAPTGASVSDSSVAENAANGTVVGTVTGTDPDAGAVLTYSLTNNAGGRFTINSTTGQITVANGSLLDYEAATSHDITVRVTDQDGLTFDKVFTIDLTDVAGVTQNGTSAANTLTGTNEGDTLNGLGGNDTLNGLAGNDTLDGGAGNDTMNGGAGNDIYIVDSNNDVVNESANAGIDEVKTSLSSYTLDANVENLTSTATDGFTGAGNALDNVITGGAGDDVMFGDDGNDILRGGTGDDVMEGDAGNDRFEGQGGVKYITTGDGLDTLVFNANSGDFQVDDFTVGSDKIDMRGTGVTAATAAQNITITEFAGGGVLVEYGSSDIWIPNLMPGELTFAGDFIFDSGSSGDNHAPTGASLSGGSIAENAANGTVVGTVTGTDPDAGSVLTYTLTNNAGGRFAINSTTGQITVANGSLLDYETTTSHDVTVRVTDQDGLTFDKIFTIGLTDVAGVTQNGTSSANTLTGTNEGDVLNGLGGNDTLNGLAGNDTLDGGAGNDTMNGGVGNDTYIVDSNNDIVNESANAGIDEVKTSLSSYTLDANVENLTSTALNGFTGAGNALDNVITGGAGDDVMFGDDGNDTLRGGTGDDVMQGDAGNDRFEGQGGVKYITTGDGQDTLVFNANSGDFQVDDFANGSDKIDMRGTGVTAGTAAQDVAITEFAGGGVLVEFGSSDIWMPNLMPGDLTFGGDFIFDNGSQGASQSNAQLSLFVQAMAASPNGSSDFDASVPATQVEAIPVGTIAPTSLHP